MIRFLWLLVSAAAAIIFAAPIHDELPNLVTSLTGSVLPAPAVALLKNDPTVTFVGPLAAGAVILTLVAFLTIAVIEGLFVALARYRLKQATSDSGPNLPLNEERYREIYAQAPYLEDIAYHHAGTLRPVARGLKGSVAASTYFGPNPLVDQRLFFWLFGPLPLALAGLGAVAFASTLSDLFAAGQGGLAAGALALSLASGAALIVYILTRTVAAWRRLQAERFCADLDRALMVKPLSAELADLIAANDTHAHDISQAIQALEAAVERTAETGTTRIVASLDGTARAISNSLHADMTSAVKEPLSRISFIAKQLSEDQSAQIQQVLRNTLKAFLTEIEGHIGLEIRAMNEVLEKTTSAATALEKILASSGKAMLKFSKTQTAELTAATGQQAQAIATATARLEALAAGLETIARTVLPLLDGVRANQTALLNAVESEGSAAQVIGATARELSAAATASKDGLDGVRALAEQLRQTSANLAALGSGHRPLPGLNTGDSGEVNVVAEMGSDEASADQFGAALRKLQALRNTSGLPDL